MDDMKGYSSASAEVLKKEDVMIYFIIDDNAELLCEKVEIDE